MSRHNKAPKGHPRDEISLSLCSLLRIERPHKHQIVQQRHHNRANFTDISFRLIFHDSSGEASEDEAPLGMRERKNSKKILRAMHSNAISSRMHSTRHNLIRTLRNSFAAKVSRASGKQISEIDLFDDLRQQETEQD